MTHQQNGNIATTANRKYRTHYVLAGVHLHLEAEMKWLRQTNHYPLSYCLKAGERCENVEMKDDSFHFILRANVNSDLWIS